MKTALIAGRGGLPAAVVAAMGARPMIAMLDGFAPDGLTPDLTFRIERLVPFLRALEDAGVNRVTFAGAVQRPRLDPSLFDPQTAAMVPRLLASMQAGDDATLRVVLEIFEEAGFSIAGVADLAPGLVPGPGVLCGTVTPLHESDAVRAAAIVSALGAVDVGQGCVVAEGLCLAVEALPGTDAMLAQVADLGGLHAQGTGLVYKAAKPGQDRRIDLPTLGPATVDAASKAGLAGIAFAAGEVICLDLTQMVAQATAQGLFLWAR